MAEWIKHNQSKTSPVPLTSLVEIETYASIAKDKFYAFNIDWSLVKFYKVIK